MTFTFGENNMTDQTHEISLNGIGSDYERFAKLADEHGLTTQKRTLVLNSETIQQAPEIVFISGSLALIAKCVYSYLKERKKKLQILKPDLNIVLENFSVEEIKELLSEDGHYFVKDWTVPTGSQTTDLDKTKESKEDENIEPNKSVDTTP